MEGGAGALGGRAGAYPPHCGDLGGVWWGSLLGVFPGCEGAEGQWLGGRRASRGGGPRPRATEPGLEEQEEEEEEEEEE